MKLLMLSNYLKDTLTKYFHKPLLGGGMPPMKAVKGINKNKRVTEMDLENISTIV